ncbi:MAG: PKD domain-containing protein, partial [Flavobacteriales bacterium]
MMNSSLRVVFALVFGFCVAEGWAQGEIFVPISEGGTYTVDCDAGNPIFFTDDNSGSTDAQDPYSNQDYTITLCPSTPGDAVQVNFLSFDLQTNANPNNNDVLLAYNGDSPAADLVGIGAGNSFVGVSITASIDNPTGCVTFSFNVNNNATGGDVGWVAEVLCVTPCSYPEAGISLVSPAPFPDNPISVGVCPDELVTFDASTSTPGAPEFPVDSLIWNWGDGTVETTAVSDGWQQSHSYTTPGEYIVTLVVQDINDCNSTNLFPHQVLVSTIPIFNTEFTTPLCEDAPGFLNGDPVQSITWTALPPVGVSELADLPDATGVAFTSELFIDFFDTDQVLENCEDIELITANIEHSFIGD